MTVRWQEDAEYLELVADLIYTDEVQNLVEFKQHHYSNRLEHSINVSYRSFLLAKKWNGDLRATARAGLLHDLFHYDWRTNKSDEGSHAYIHPRVALENARKLTEISKLEEDIIVKHMFGATIAPPKYKESYIVTLVDKYCACEEVFVPLYQQVKIKAYQYFGLANVNV
ncbi:HD domain-containing protein [Vagococcus fluvialis]|uniref:HD domain-containing protein n=1 Tax=Vagococcus fluvialis TaxID=2738 RepID=UPI001432B4C2|nr:HD domain-containing protein [Vagococcus fluvialis]MBO0488019.1 HD domain-containing protein [Vagococcus fluvialis]MDT2781720.1 HD domain-containing protein [Vagococcus fluvialis]NKC60008.1 HD domain-containing protein [Vagococcus fluvialis]NKD50735.1 HD domain-containing protein [Vagococcus fluvialis]UDM79921.1 HD domain-containing protein [Vagococcus fluvialis]